MDLYSDGVRLYPYKTRQLKWSRNVKAEDLMSDDGPEPNDAVIEEVKSAARKHFELLQRRELPDWKIESIEMDEIFKDEWWIGQYPHMTLTDYIGARWHNEHLDELTTYFKPAGFFSKAIKEVPQPADIPMINSVTFKFVATFRTSIVKDADLVKLPNH